MYNYIKASIIGFFVASGLLIFIVVCFYAYLFFTFNGSEECLSKLGQFGDYFGGIINPFFSFFNILALLLVSYSVFYFENRREIEMNHKNDENKIMDDFKRFISDANFVESRFLIMECLMPHGQFFRNSVKEIDDEKMEFLNFTDVCEVLIAINRNIVDVELAPKLNRAAVLIREIPSFFWMLDMGKDMLSETELVTKQKTFSKIYCWYWEHVLKFRIKNENDIMFRHLDWLSCDQNILNESRIEFEKYIIGLTPHQKELWDKIVK